MIKKSIFYTLLVSLFFAGLGAAQPVAAEEKISKGTIIVKIGIVKVLRSGEAKWTNAKKGMMLFGGDQIKTMELSRASIIYNDGSVTKLNEKTNLLLADDSKKKKTNRLKLLVGQLWAKVKKRGINLEIETPSAVAAIKGTALELEADKSGHVNLIVWNGLVEFFNEMGKVEVGPGHQSTADKKKAPSKPKKVGLGQRDQWFEQVIEIPREKRLDLKIKDKDGKTNVLKLKYKKK